LPQPYLSVIVPCYNERENLLAGVLEEMHDYLRRQTYSYEVIVSDDGSSDDSREIAHSRIVSLDGFSLVANAHGGKPGALWGGIQAAQGEVLLFTDMDQSTPIDQVAKLIPFLEQGFGVVIGSRGIDREQFAWYRRLGSAVFRNFRRLLLLRTISDTQCGFKAMKRDVALQLFPQLEAIRTQQSIKGWKVTAFDVELLYLADRAGQTIKEVLVDWSNRDLATGKGKSYVSESREMAAQVWRIKVNAWRNYYSDRDSVSKKG